MPALLLLLLLLLLLPPPPLPLLLHGHMSHAACPLLLRSPLAHPWLFEVSDALNNCS